MTYRYFLLILLLFLNIIHAQTLNESKTKPLLKTPEVSAKSWILMDYEEGMILAEHNAYLQHEPASVTKIMTGYLIADAINNGKIALTDLAPVSIKAWKQRGSRMFIKEGAHISVQDLMTGLIVQSGNDAAIALAEFLAGDENNFVTLMNLKAEELGMKNTHFTNSNGLPNNDHYSAAYDLALLSRALIQNFPEHYSIYAQKSFTWSGIKQNNRNKLLWTNSSVDGIKTGHTNTAGYNIAVSATKNGRRFIAIVLGATSEAACQQGANDLVEFGFKNFKIQKLYKKNDILFTSPVKDGIQSTVKLGLSKDVAVLLPSTKYGNVSAKLNVKNHLFAPVTHEKNVGELKIYFNNQNLYNFPLVALEEVDQLEIQERIWLSFKRKLHNRYEKLKAAL